MGQEATATVNSFFPTMFCERFCETSDSCSVGKKGDLAHLQKSNNQGQRNVFAIGKFSASQRTSLGQYSPTILNDVVSGSRFFYSWHYLNVTQLLIG